MVASYPKVIANGRFSVEKQLGEGCFGAVHLGSDVTNGRRVAIKFESPNCGAPGSLASENRILSKLSKPRPPSGFAEVFHYGREGIYDCLVMELLSKSLEDCMQGCKGQVMDPKSVLLIAEQAVHRLEYLHSRGLVHRDIKPENFMFGAFSKAHHLYLIDFGLSMSYFNRIHVEMTTDNTMVGTARYASINTHKGILQSRRDDLEAVGHMLMYFLRGSLPWSGLKGARTDEEKYRMIGSKKQSTSLDELGAGHPDVFKEYLKYCRSLPYEERPDYERLRFSFKRARRQHFPSQDHEFQWLSQLDERQRGELLPLKFDRDLLQPDDQESPEAESTCICFPLLRTKTPSSFMQTARSSRSSQGKLASE